MSNELSKEELLKVINLVKPAVSNQPFIPALSHIAFSEGRVEAYNDITGISIDYKFPVEGCVPAELLTKAVGSFNSDDIVVTLKDSNVQLASGRAKFKLPMLPIESFPFNIENILKEDSSVTITLSADFLKGLEMCLVSIGSDTSRPALSGVTIEQDDDDTAVLYSSNNVSISRYKTSNSIKLPGRVPIILPADFCNYLLSISGKYSGEVITLSMSASGLLAEWKSAVLFTRSMSDDEPMDFAGTIRRFASDAEIESEAVKIPDSFDSAFNRALLVMSGELDKATKVTLSAGRLSLLSVGAGEAAESMTFKTESNKDIEFHVDPSLVVKASKSATSISLLDKVVVLSSDKFKYIHLIAHCSAK